MSEKTNSKVAFTNLPAGTVTFLFTDIEGSTKLLKQLDAESSINGKAFDTTIQSVDMMYLMEILEIKLLDNERSVDDGLMT